MKSLTKSIRAKLVSQEVHALVSLPAATVLRDVQSAAQRAAYRGGHTSRWLVLAGRRIAIKGPRGTYGGRRGVGAAELFAWAAHAEPLDAATRAAVAGRVSPRRYETMLDPLPAGAAQSAASRTAVPRRFVALSAERLRQWLSRLIEVALPVVMIDGIHLMERLVLVAWGFDVQGRKHVLGVREGSTEKTQVVRALLVELIEHGLDADALRLWVIDGGKALRRALSESFGQTALVQHCQEHKRGNVLGHLPEALHASVGRVLRDACDSEDAGLAQRQLKRLANSLAKPHPGTAASLREGLAETLTLIHLRIDAALYRTLRTTSPTENLNGLIAHYTRNVKRWGCRQILPRWIGTALHEAGRGFRAVRGHRDMRQPRSALARRVPAPVDVKSKVAAHRGAHSADFDELRVTACLTRSNWANWPFHTESP